jgi:hypothetical protein
MFNLPTITFTLPEFLDFIAYLQSRQQQQINQLTAQVEQLTAGLKQSTEGLERAVEKES